MSRPIRLTMLSGSFEYDSEDSLTVLRDYLAEHAPAIETDLIIYQTEEDNPSLENLDETDVLLVFTRRLEFDALVLGGSYDGHFGSGPACRVELAPDSAQHPVLAEVLPFESQGSLYRNTPIADDTTLLLTGRADEKEEPIAWTRSHNGGRVFYTSLGHQRDFWELDFLRLIENAIVWVSEGGAEK